jgi:uncharacterized protein (TIGR03067 family)
MRRFLLVSLMMTGLLQVFAWGGTSTVDEKSLEGTWLPIEAQLAGQKFPDEVLKAMKLTMADGKYAVMVGTTLDKGTYKLDPTATPPAIDIVGVEGPNRGKTLLAIYEQMGDSLRVCYDLAGKKRPTEFKSEKNNGHFLVTYQRAKQ